MKTNASSTASAWGGGVKGCICPCDLGTKSHMVVQIFHLACINYIREVSNCCFDFLATKFTLVLLSKIISKMRYSKSCILYHTTEYTTIEALLYHSLRFIVTFKSNRSMISFGRKHCKYDMPNYILSCILSMHCI